MFKNVLKKAGKLFQKSEYSSDKKIDDQIEQLSSEAVELLPFLAFSGLVRSVEQRDVIGQYYRVPYFYWKSRLPKAARLAAAENLRKVAAAEVVQGYNLIIYTGLIMRLLQLNERERQSFLAYQEELQDIRYLSPELLFEFITILYAERNHQAVKRYTGLAFARSDLPFRQRELYCDFHFEASYQLLASRIFQNNIEQPHIAELKDSYDLCVAQLGATNPHLKNYLGVIACIEKRFEDAVSLHASKDLKQGYYSQYFRSGANVVSLDLMREFADRDYVDEPSLRFKMQHQKAKSCTLVSCDSGYFYMYIKGFVASFALHNPGGIVHIHAVDFEPEQKRITQMETEFNIGINVTLDAQSLEALTPDLMKGYCAGARYMYLPEYLDRYERVIITDIDGVLRTSEDAIWQDREDAVLLSTLALESNRKAHFAFWSNIGAGATGVPANPSGRLFSRAISAYLRYRFDQCNKTDERFFFSDQVGLLLAVLVLKNECSYLRMPQLFDQSGSNKVGGRARVKKAKQQELLEKMRLQKEQ
ncbi:MAG: hypothetical protein COB37_05150 [Kordiimonadales bacterium]|nr:MAG: hypothetical protein COB37_05150 [Kordiimonadales bacterium]